MRRLQAKLLFFISVLLMMAGAVTVNTYAAGPLDEIVDYEIDATVNDDATVTLVYHIEWKVLDSDSEGPLSWVRVGIPNRHYGDRTLWRLANPVRKGSSGLVFSFEPLFEPLCQMDKCHKK